MFHVLKKLKHSFLHFFSQFLCILFAALLLQFSTVVIKSVVQPHISLDILFIQKLLNLIIATYPIHFVLIITWLRLNISFPYINMDISQFILLIQKIWCVFSLMDILSTVPLILKDQQFVPQILLQTHYWHANLRHVLENVLLGLLQHHLKGKLRKLEKGVGKKKCKQGK